MVDICLTFNFAGIKEVFLFQLANFDEASSQRRAIRISTKQGRKGSFASKTSKRVGSTISSKETVSF